MPASHPIRAWLRTRARTAISLAAAVGLTAQGEFHLAILAGWPAMTAWLLPVALDIYALAAFARSRAVDTFSALSLMIGTNALYHLAHTGLIPVDWRLIVLTAALPPLIVWRVHALDRHHGPEPTAPPELSQDPDPVPAPEVPPAPLPPAWPASPAARVCLPIRCAASPLPSRRQRKGKVSTRPTGTAPPRKRTTKSGTGRPVAETVRLAEALRREHPDWPKKRIATALGITDRALRMAYQEARGISVA